MSNFPRFNVKIKEHKSDSCTPESKFLVAGMLYSGVVQNPCSALLPQIDPNNHHVCAPFTSAVSNFQAACIPQESAQERRNAKGQPGDEERDTDSIGPDLTDANIVAFSSRLIAAARAVESKRADRLFNDQFAEVLVRIL